ncbi:Galectin domain-containing protein [Meloidogyne graminicola]|uniref:Galectin domain-containing protein n=1 Tax=Meloidogyne graminicola TaxID=189291 RepID=A0A8S9ZIA6_9BILA|nr:Galectin domain-containing protein [Meloidogyne graminicola]
MSINNLIKFLLIFFVYLTDMKTTHHQLLYNAHDQCKLQPGQVEHNAYGFVFKLPENLLCDELLICYPSQLSGNNTLNGTIRLIPYRLKSTENKTMTKLCEEKKKEFCEGEGKQSGNCKVGKPGSVLWHGIKLTSAYEGNALITNISLYQLINTSYFDIELINKYLDDKHVQGKGIEFIRDNQLIKEYFSKISKGQYLHRYAGLWTLGLDMLPSAAQKELNLFVYRNCSCGMEVWFKRPTTSKTLIPKVIEGEKEKFKGKLYKDKDCPKRQISNKKFFLGELGNDEEIFVNFTIWSGSEGKYGKIELKNEMGKIFELYANEKVIKHIFKGEVKREIKQPFNILSIGATLVLTFRLSQYYIWLGYSSDMFGNEFIVSKFFTEKWWEGNLFGNSNIELIGDGDFNIVTPVIGKKLNEKEIEKLSNIFKHKPKSFNYKFNMDTIKSDELTIIFYCKPDTFSNTFYITLNAQKIKAFSLEFDFDTLKLSTSSATKGKKSTYYDSYNITTIQKGKPFEYKLNVNKAGGSMFNYEVYINREEFKNNKIIMNSPTWLIDEIEISKSLEVMDIQINEIVYEMPQLKHKIKLERKIKGTILCFDAKIPKAEVMKGEKSFQVYLLNEVNDFNDKCNWRYCNDGKLYI